MASLLTQVEKRVGHMPPGAVLAGTLAVFLFPVIMVGLFPVQLDTIIDKSSYLVFHNLAEIFSIMVSLSVFSVGWFTFEQSRDRHVLFLGTVFLAVGLLDLMHTMSNAAMPAFITPNSTNKSTQFWIAARLIDSSAFLASAFVYPEKESRWLTKNVLMAAAITVTGAVFTLIVFFPGVLPATAVQGVGLTPLKRYLEFLVILLLLLAGAAYWKRMARTGNRDLLIYLAAFTICICSEILFASYKTGFDTYNVLGHIYKVAAFYLIYKGVFISSVNHPYVRLSDAVEKLRRETVSRSELEREIEERTVAEEELRAANAELDDSRRQAEQAAAGLRESEEKFSLAFANNPAAIAMTRFEDGLFLEVNDTWLAMNGYSRDEVIGFSARNMPLWPTVEAATRFLQELREKGTLRGWEQELLRKSGESFVAQLSAQILNVRGEQVILLTLVDITARKRAEELLRESEERLRLLGDNLPNSAVYQYVHGTDGSGRFAYVSEGIQGLNGVSVEEVLRDAGTLRRQIPEEYFARFVEAEAQSARDLSDFNMDVPMLRTDGEVRWMQLHSRPRRMPDGRVVWDGVQTDITERKRNENALQEKRRVLEESRAELEAANTLLRNSRRAALNMMADADTARRQAEQANAELRSEIVERKRAEEALKMAYQRIELLAETSARLLEADSPQEVVDYLCQKVMVFLDCHVYFNFLVDEEQGRLHLNASAGIPDEEAKRIEWLDYGTAVCGCAARDACRIVAEDIPTTPDPRTELVKSCGIQAYACHPIMSRNRVLGTLSFGTRSRGRFSGDDLTLMKAVADQVAIAMERTQNALALTKSHDVLEQRVAERTEQLSETVETLLIEMSNRERAEKSLQRLNKLYSVLSETNQTIVRAVDRESLFREFCRIAVECGGFLLAWVGLVNENSGQVEKVASCGATGYLDPVRITRNEEPAGLGPTGISIREGSFYICNNFQNDPCTRPWHEPAKLYDINSSASVALKEEGRVIGALTLYSTEKAFFDQQHAALIVQMGEDMSFALDYLAREEQRRTTERALREETLERLRAVEELRRQEHILIQQSRQAAMGEMIGNIAHQWRQPLNTLGLFTQRLGFFYGSPSFDKEFLDSSVAKSMEIIQYMSRTIDDFRNFFSTERDKAEFAADEAVNKALSLVESSFKEYHIAIDRESGEGVTIYGYPNEYAQVLLNILSNAKDAFREHNVETPRITISTGTNNGVSVVTIADNAGGIPEDIMDKVFDPYFTTKGPQQGTGVGLFMSRIIIENNMGGRLSVRNTGAGAEFRIEV